MPWSNDPRIIKEGGYQGTRDPGEPPAALYRRQIVAPTKADVYAGQRPEDQGFARLPWDRQGWTVGTGPC